MIFSLVYICNRIKFWLTSVENFAHIIQGSRVVVSYFDGGVLNLPTMLIRFKIWKKYSWANPVI